MSISRTKRLIRYFKECILFVNVTGLHHNARHNKTRSMVVIVPILLARQHFLQISQQWETSLCFSICRKGKVKCTLVQALRFCTGRTAHRGSRGIALPFHDHGTRRRWGVSVTPRLLFAPGKDPVPIVQEAGWASAPVWRGAENLAPIRSPGPSSPKPVAI